MRLFDTHAHITDERFDEDREAVIQRLTEAGVELMLLVGDASKEEQPVYPLAEAHPNFYAATGVHPHDASEWNACARERVIRWMAHPKSVALGEIGLDYHYDLSPRDVQRQAFDEQLELAYELNKPVILHIREAHGDATDMLTARMKAGRMPRGVMHCYTGSWESAKQYLNMGLYISFSGAVTFKNAPKLAEVAVNTPADRLLIETIRKLYPQLHVQYGVRGTAVVNDVTREDAAEVGMEEVAEIIDNGDCVLGTLLYRTSPEFNESFYNADVVICKGMGNYEGLHACDRGNMWFLLIAKCTTMARLTKSPKGSVLCLWKA